MQPPELATPPPLLAAKKRMNWGPMIAVVAAIIGWFVFIDPNLQSAKRAAAQAEEQKYVAAVDLALIYYTANHGDRYPDFSGDMVSLLRPYIKDRKVIEAMPRFVWNTKLSGLDVDHIYDSGDQWIIYSPTPGTHNYAIGFVDGHARFANPWYLNENLRKSDELLKEDH